MSFSALRRLDLNLLVVLHTLLETASTTLAAERLHMSQPAVSRALARLRVVLDDRLMVKGARGMVPTPRAEALAAPLARLLAELDAFLDAPRFSPDLTDRVFRIATTDYGAIAVLPGLAAILAREAPRAGIDVSPFSRDAFRRLAGGELDLVLYSDDPAPEALRSQALFAETYRSVVRRGHPILARLRDGRVGLDAFLDYPHALVSVFGGRSGAVDEALAALGRRRRIAMWLPYFATAARVAAATDLVVTLPTRAVGQLAGPHGLAAFDPPLEVQGYGYRMIWHERSHADLASAWLRRQVLAAIR